MHTPSRREFLRSSAGLTAGMLAGGAVSGTSDALWGQMRGERPEQDSAIEILNPSLRVPVSIIVDDSTCLVNLNRYAIPQFAAAWKHERYHHDWRKMPLEIPDSFVQKFADWSQSEGVRGKYSIVPYPACVGRLDREVPGWTLQEVKASLDLVRRSILPNWDIHPEMVTHTRVIDLKTGHPYPSIGPEWCENWRWTDGKSVDEIASYMDYALRILHNLELPCEGVTTPGGFGNRVLPELSQATLEACRNVYRTEIPHYFRHLYSAGERSVVPRVEYASGLSGDSPQCVVSIIGCTGDWTGSWDCSNRGYPDRFITPDLEQGRLVDVIEREEPAVIVCHWTGIYFNGEEVGLRIFQEMVKRLHQRFDNLLWMKNSEIARYWAARELTAIRSSHKTVHLQAPYHCPGFTLRIPNPDQKPVRYRTANQQTTLKRVANVSSLRGGCQYDDGSATVVCFDLEAGASELDVG